MHDCNYWCPATDVLPLMAHIWIHTNLLTNICLIIPYVYLQDGLAGNHEKIANAFFCPNDDYDVSCWLR